jgi:hypothetical protein
MNGAILPFFTRLRGVNRLFTLKMSSQYSGKIKERKAGLNIEGKSRPSQTKYFCMQLRGLHYTNRLKYLQEGRMPHTFCGVFL